MPDGPAITAARVGPGFAALAEAAGDARNDAAEVRATAAAGAALGVVAVVCSTVGGASEIPRPAGITESMACDATDRSSARVAEMMSARAVATVAL